MRTEQQTQQLKKMNLQDYIWHWLQIVGMKLLALFPAFAGSLVSVMYEKQITTRRAILLVLSGTAIAGWVTPLVGHWLGLGDELQSALSFLLGLIGMRVVGFAFTVLDVVREDKDLMKGLITFLKLRK